MKPLDRSVTKGGRGDRPTLLMVGSGDPMDAALKVALDRHGLSVEEATLAELSVAIHVTAPDVMLLVGDAAEDGGLVALTMLGAGPASVPVVLLAKDERLESRMHAFRHGAVAVVPRSASADAVARRVVALERELSQHFDDEKTGEIGEATFDELVELVKKELRSGILSVHPPRGDGETTRVVLGAGRPVAEAVQEFVQRLRPHVTPAEPMHYQFHTSAGGPVGVLELGGTKSTEMIGLPNLRVLVVDDDPTRADTLAHELRERGALVFVTDTRGSGLDRATGLDPQIAIVDRAGLQGDGFEVIRRIRKHMRLRWASMLVAPWEEIWPSTARMPDMHQLASRIVGMLDPDRDLAERAAEDVAFDTRLESTGPARLLRVLVESGQTVHATVRNPKARVELDLAEGLVVGATSHVEGGKVLAGTKALASLLALASGRVHIERRANPAVANVMSPVDEALSAANEERDELRNFVSFAEDEPTSDAHTVTQNLETRARAGEALLGEDRPPSTPPKKVTVPLPRPRQVVGGPVAAGERSLKNREILRKQTLAMGVVAVRPPPPEEPPPPPPPPPPIVEDDDDSGASDESTAIMTYEGMDLDLPPQVASPPATAPDARSDPTTLVPPASSSAELVALTRLTDSSEDTIAATRPAELESSESLDSGDLASLAVDPPPLAPEAPPIKIGSLPPPPLDLGPPPGIPPALPMVPTPSEAPATQMSTDAPARRAGGGVARTLAKVLVVVAALVLFTVIALIGYRYSGIREPHVEQVLAMVGAGSGPRPTPIPDVAPPAPTPPVPTPPAPTPVPEVEPTPTPEVEVEPTPTPEVEVEPTPTPEVEVEPTPTPEVEVAVDPSDAQAVLRQAEAHGNTDQAETLYRRVLELDPREHHAMVGLGRLLIARERAAEAVPLLRSAVARRPRRAPYLIWLGDALAASGDAAGARAEWERALEVEPTNATARRRLGQ